MKQINEITSIVIASQTKTELDSNEQQIYINGLNQDNTYQSEYTLSDNDFKTLKLANCLIISNLFGMVFILLGCTIVYMMIYSKWSTEFIISLQLFIISDVLIILEKLLFFHTLINKKKLIKLCLYLNMSSMMLKLTASGILSDMSSCQLIVSLVLIFLSLPHNILIKVLTRRWKCIPERLWRKQIILIRKQVPQAYH